MDNVPPCTFTLSLFGRFELNGPAESVDFASKKAAALLAFLACTAPEAQRRETLAGLLWGSHFEAQAHQNLRQSLYVLRRVLGDGSIVNDGHFVSLRNGVLDCDVPRFEELLSDGTRDALAAAVKIYKGCLLVGFDFDQEAWRDWLTRERQRLQRRALDAIVRLGELELVSGKAEAAAKAAERAIAENDMREDAHRLLIRALAASGRRPDALRHYEHLVALLKRELDVEPDADTTTLARELRKPAQDYSEIPSLPLPDRPSMAVLPFDVIGGNRQASDLADGLLEDLITALAKVRELFVIDRHSTEIYKGRPVNVRDVAGKLGVRFVLAGSIRTAGDRLRCSAQLVDSVNGQHLWAVRYDRQIDDIFALQDEIVWHILLELQVTLTEGESARIASRGTRNLQAWLLRVQAAGELGRVTREGTNRARALFQAAYEADVNWARPLAGIAASHFFDARYRWSSSRDKSITTGIEYAERAMAMDPDEPFGYVILRCLNYLLGRHEEALEIIGKAVTFAPNDQLVLGNLASQLLVMDEIGDAIRAFGRMMRLGPNPHIMLQRAHGLALMLAGRNEQAIDVLENLVRREPKWRDGRIHLAAAYANAGRLDQARIITKQVLEEGTAHTASYEVSLYVFRNPERTEWLRDLFIKAGLPE